MPSVTYKVPGPVAVEYNSVPVGKSKAGAIIRIRTNWAPVLDDMHGGEPADYIFAGKSATVELISLTPGDVKTAGIWDLSGGLLMGVTNGILVVGALASALGKSLTITERDAAVWGALSVVPIDPETLTFLSSAELQVPLTFLVVPDVNDKLFATIPAYVV